MQFKGNEKALMAERLEGLGIVGGFADAILAEVEGELARWGWLSEETPSEPQPKPAPQLKPVVTHKVVMKPEPEPAPAPALHRVKAGVRLGRNSKPAPEPKPTVEVDPVIARFEALVVEKQADVKVAKDNHAARLEGLRNVGAAESVERETIRLTLSNARARLSAVEDIASRREAGERGIKLDGKAVGPKRLVTLMAEAKADVVACESALSATSDELKAARKMVTKALKALESAGKALGNAQRALARAKRGDEPVKVKRPQGRKAKKTSRREAPRPAAPLSLALAGLATKLAAHNGSETATPPTPRCAATAQSAPAKPVKKTPAAAAFASVADMFRNRVNPSPVMGDVVFTATFSYENKAAFLEPFSGKVRRAARSGIGWAKNPAKDGGWIFAGNGGVYTVTGIDAETFSVQVSGNPAGITWMTQESGAL